MTLHGGRFCNYYHRGTGGLCGLQWSKEEYGGRLGGAAAPWPRCGHTTASALRELLDPAMPPPVLPAAGPPPVTHVVCANLPDAKVKQLARERDPTPHVRPEWVVDSIKAARLLPVRS